jgi:hypothetical protein
MRSMLLICGSLLLSVMVFAQGSKTASRKPAQNSEEEINLKSPFAEDGFRMADEDASSLAHWLINPQAFKCIQDSFKKANFDSSEYSLKSVRISQNGSQFQLNYKNLNRDDKKQLIVAFGSGLAVGNSHSFSYKCDLK